MNKILSLAKIFFLEQFKTAFSKVSPNKRARSWTLVAIVTLLVMLSLGVSFFGMFIALKDVGKPQYILYIGFAYLTFLGLGFFFFQIYNTFFGAKDYNFLASLPLKSHEIITAKLIALVLNAYFVQIVLLLPVYILFWVGVGISFSGFVFLLLGFLLLPFFIFFVCALVALGLHFFARGTSNPKKFKQTSTYALSFLLIFLFLIINNSGLMPVLTGRGVPTVMKVLFPTISLLFYSIVGQNWLLFLGFVAITATVGYATILLLSKGYFKFNNNFGHQNTKKHKKFKFSENSIFKSLTLLELKRYFASPLYVINTAFGAVIMLVASVALPIIYFVVLPNSGMLEAVKGSSQSLLVLASGVVMAIAFLSSASSSSVSLEGKSFYFKKSLPIKFKTQMLAKVFLNMLIGLPMLVCFFTTLPIMISLQLHFYQILALFALIITSHAAVSFLGLFINLMFIRLDWVNEAVIIKQSMSSFLAVMLGMALAAAAIAFVVLLLPYAPLALLLLALNIVFVLLALLLWRLITTVGKKRYLQVN